MNDIYVPELNIQLLEKDIMDAIYELQKNCEKVDKSIHSLVATTDSLKSGWSTSEGIVVTDKIKKITNSMEEISKKLMSESNSIPTSITYEII